MQKRYHGKYPNSLQRTLQRRMKKWRALEGPEREMMFRQKHESGGLSDFTTLKTVSITIQGQSFGHLLYHFRLAYSGWCYAKVVQGGESFTALAEGLQNALQRLGGVRQEHRSDSLAAAYKNLDADSQADLTGRYDAFCKHYEMTPTCNNRGKGHENGSIESPHGHLKNRMEQQLLLRGSRDFKSVGAYQHWLDEVVAGINRGHQVKVESERPYLRALLRTKAIDFTELMVRVSSESMINVALTVYSVPSRLVGESMKIYFDDDGLVAWLDAEYLFTKPRIGAAEGKRRAGCIDYGDVMDSLNKKPMALYRSQYGDDLLPDDNCCHAWEYFEEKLEPRAACKLMVGCLALAAEYDCEVALGEYLLEEMQLGQISELLSLHKRFGQAPPPQPAQ